MKWRSRNEKIRSDILPDRIVGEEAQIDRFLDENSDSLLRSVSLWGNVSSDLQFLKNNEEIAAAFNKGVADCMANTMGQEPNPRQVDREAERLTKHLVPYTFVVARRLASEGAGMIKSVGEVNKLTRIYPGLGVPYIFESKLFPIKDYANVFTKVSEYIRSADTLSDEVLTKLCKQYSTPSDIMLLAELNKDGANEVSPLLAEFSAMIATDWHRVDESKSILKQHSERLATDPSAHVASFCEDAVNIRNGIPSSVNAMAQFALLSHHQDDTPIDRANQLFSNREKWSEIPDLLEAFNDYVDHSASLVKNVFTELSTVTTAAGRSDFSDEQFLQIRAAMEVNAISNRDDERHTARMQRRDAKLYSSPRSVNNVKAVDNLGVTIEALSERPVLVTRFVNGRGYETEEVGELTAHDVIEYFNLPENKQLGDDMRTVIEYLQQPSRNFAGSKRVRSNNGSVRVDGKQMNLWRFAPNDSPYVKVNTTNRFYRVVYGVHDSKLVVLDVLSHEDFDKRYK